MKTLLKIVLVLFAFLQYQTQLTAQSDSAPILFIYDASGSMWGQMEGKTKKEIAAEVLSTAVNNLSENQKVGLMAYGHRKKGDCDDVEFLVDLNNTGKKNVIEAVNGITPLGRTPLARSATLAINSLRDAKTKATIILITDGIESCDGNICDVVLAAKAEGIDFKLHIVGFGLKESETEQLKCAAKAGDGQYYNADNAGGLGEMLDEATSETIDKPVDNFSVYATKNGEAVDVWIKAYKIDSKESIDAGRSYRDSAFIYLPEGKYNIVIRPLENTDISETTIQVDIKNDEVKHETISFDAAVLSVYATNNNEGWDAIVKIKNKATGKINATARTYGRTKTMEVDPDVYDISFKALNIKGLDIDFTMENVKIIAGETKSVEHNFETGIAMIGVKTATGELIDASVSFSEINSGKYVAANRTYTSENNNPKKFTLSTGTYVVKILTLGAHKGQSNTFNITIKTGETTEKTIIF